LRVASAGSPAAQVDVGADALFEWVAAQQSCPLIEGWQRIEIDGRAADLFEPDAVSGAAGAVVFLHDFDAQSLADNPVFTSELARRHLRAVCPIADRCWWTTTPCADFDPALSPLDFVRRAIVSFFDTRWAVRTPQIGLLGIGMGGQGVLQLAYRWPREFPRVAAIAPAIDFHNWHGYGLSLDQMFKSKEAARQETATLHIHPLNWPKHQFFCCDPADEFWFDGAERLAMKLSSMGIPFDRDLTTSAGGHTWDYFERMAPTAIEFLTAPHAP
jgi:S-formylglutathione hydrolase